MLLEYKNIFKTFGGNQVLKGISFSAESGKALGILGRNGAGKTTLLRILLNVFPADSGEILVDGRAIDYKKVRIGYLPEERGLYPKKVVSDQLIYLAQLKSMSAKAAAESVNWWLNRLEIKEYGKKRLETLSKGNQQKIQLIAALVHDPEIVILDEPFSGLDPVNAVMLRSVVLEQVKKGKIVIFSSHQMNYIEEICDNIAIINNGSIVVSGELRKIKRLHGQNSLIVRTENPTVLIGEYGAVSVSNDPREVLIQIPESLSKQEMMRTLVKRFNVDAVCLYEPSLNDIFINYTDTGN